VRRAGEARGRAAPWANSKCLGSVRRRLRRHELLRHRYRIQHDQRARSSGYRRNLPRADRNDAIGIRRRRRRRRRVRYWANTEGIFSVVKTAVGPFAQ